MTNITNENREKLDKSNEKYFQNFIIFVKGVNTRVKGDPENVPLVS